MNRFILNRLACTLLFIYFVLLFFQTPMGGRWIDFPVYWEAGLKALAHETVYNHSVFMQFRYSPFIALIFGWILRPFGFEAASWIFQKASLLCWLSLFYIWVRDARELGEIEFIPSFFIGTLLFGSALRLDLQFGQVNSFTFLLLYYGMKFSQWEDERGMSGRVPRLMLSGFLLAIAMQMKLYCLISLLFLVVNWRIWTGAITLIFVLLTTFGVMAAYHGVSFTEGELINWVSLLGESTPDLIMGLTNVNVLGVVGRLVNPFCAQIIWFLALAGYHVIVWKWRKKPFFIQYAVGSAGIYFLHPLTWTYWVLFLAPVLLVGMTVSPLRLKDKRWALLVPAFASFNMQHAYYVKEWPMLFGAVCLVIWVGLRVAQAKKSLNLQPV